MATSVRLPWLFGFAVLLLVALGTALLVGRTASNDQIVPDAVLDAQEAVANSTAESVRKSLNEGVADLGGFAAVFASGTTPAGWLEPALHAFARVHRRYDAIAVVRPHGAPLARVGRLDPGAAGAVSSARVAGIDLRRGRRGYRITEYVPIPQMPAVLAGTIDRRFLRFPTETARPAIGWIVDPNGRVLAGGSGERSGTTLNTAALRAAARRALAGDSGALVTGGSLRQQQVVAFAPVVGIGPGGRLGLGVVTEQTVTSFDLPQVNVRRQAILAGLVIAFVVLLVFGWLWLVVLRPLFGLQSEAERIAYGDLAQPVPVERYDEIGLAARALERIRLLLIRGHVGGAQRATDEPDRADATDSSGRQQEVVAFAPAVGVRAGGRSGQGVVREQTATSFDPRQVNVRRQAVLAGLVIAFVLLVARALKRIRLFTRGRSAGASQADDEASLR